MSSASSSQVPTVSQGSTTIDASGVASSEQMTRIIEKVSLGEISSTKSLVEALNSVVEDGDISKGIQWVHECVRWFSERKTEGLGAHELREYMILGELKSNLPEAKDVLTRWFISFNNKMSEEKSNQKEFSIALLYALEIVDIEIFDEDTTFFIDLAKKLFEKLMDGTFTRKSFKTKGLLMQIIHQCLVKIYEISSKELDSSDENGICKKFYEGLDTISSTNSYYPFTYQVEMLKLNFDKFDKEERLCSCYAICQRILQGAYGGLCLAHFARKLITLEFDHSALERAIEMLTKSTAKNPICKKNWHEWIDILRNLSMVVLKDVSKFDKFEDLFQQLCEKESAIRRKEDRIALKFGMIDTLVLLIQSENEEICNKSIKILIKIGEDFCKDKVSNQDLHIYEAILESLWTAYPKCKEEDKVKALIDQLVNIDVKECKERGEEWLGKNTIDEKLTKACSLTNNKTSDSLFKKFVKQESITIQEPKPSQDPKDEKCKQEEQTKLNEMHDELKKKYLYREFGEVPSLFEDELGMHVESFYFDMKYDFEYEEGKMEKVSILLQELFYKRIVNRNEAPIDVKKLLLVGNPGTGKTSITKRIAYDWANGKWGKDFEAIYVVPVRELMASHYIGDTMRRRKALSCAIVNIHFPESRDDIFNEFDELIEKDITKSSTLLILDGLDEKAGACQQILREALNVKCKLFISSRPYNLQAQRKIADLEVDCMGLNDIQVKKFIKLQLNGEKTKSLLGFLEEKETLKQVLHVPMTLNMICVLWKREKEEKVKKIMRGNLMVLYKMLVSFLWNRFIEKGFVDGPKQASKKEVIMILAQIAFKKLEKGEILFGEDMIDDLCDNKSIKATLKHAGFVLLQEAKQLYYFPHLTFQEYFAGIYLAHHLLGVIEEEKDLIEDFFISKKYNMQFNVTFDFAYEEIGLIAKKQGLNKLLELVNEEPKEELGIRSVLLMLQIFDKISGIDDYFDRLKRMIPQKVNDASTFIEKVLEFLLNSKFYHEEMKYMLKTLETMPNAIRLNSSIVDPLVKAYLTSNRIGDTKALGKIIKHVPKKMDTFVETVKSKRGERDFGVIVEMIEVSPRHRESLVEFVFDKCKNANESIRSYAYSQLGHISVQVLKKTKDIINVLLKGCSDDNKNVRTVSYAQVGATINEASEHVDREVLHILVKCRDQDEGIRKDAHNELGEFLVMAFSQRDMIIRQLREGVEDNSSKVREVSYKQFGKIIEFASDQREDILAQLYVGCKDESWHVRIASYNQLGKAMELLEEKRKEILEQLYIGCEDGDSDVRKESYGQLGKAMELMEEKREQILKQLYIGCKDDDKDVRRASYEQLGKTMEFMEEKREQILEQLYIGCGDAIFNVGKVAQYYYDEAMEKDQGEEGKIEKHYPSGSDDESKIVGDKVKSQVEKGIEEEERTLLIVQQLCVGLGDVEEIHDIAYNQLKILLEIDLDRRDKIVEKLLNECGNNNDRVRTVIYNLLGQALEIVPNQRNKIVEQLIDATSDDNRENCLVVYEQFDKALEFVEEGRERLMEKLFDGCKDMRYDVCEVAYNQLGRALEIVEDERKKIVEQIIIGCGSEDWVARGACYNHFGQAMEMVEEERGRLVERLYVGFGDEKWQVRESSYNQVGKAIELVVEEREKLLEQLLNGCDDRTWVVTTACYKQFGQAFQYIPKASVRLVEQLLEGCLHWYTPTRNVVYEQLEIAYKMHVEQREKIVDNLVEKCVDQELREEYEYETDYRDLLQDLYRGLGRMLDLGDVRRDRIVDQILLGCKDMEDNLRNEAYKQLRKVVKKNLGEDESILKELLEGMADVFVHVRRSVSKIYKDVLEEERKYSKEFFHCIVDSCLQVDDVGYEIQRRVGSFDEFFDLVMSLDLDVLMKYSREEVDSRVVALIIRQMIRRPVVFDEGSDGWRMVVDGVKNEEYNVSEEVVKAIREGVDGFKRKLGV